jgi:hypothetical protein
MWRWFVHVYARLKMMNGNICQVVGFGQLFYDSTMWMLHNYQKFVVAIAF